jgi:hypothetical protein
MSKHTDDALQILEQIIPFFQPEYSVTVNEVDNNFKSDMPFVLTSVSLEDDYEGEFESRRSLVYTLDFDTRIKYYGPLTESGSIIRQTQTNLSDYDMTSSGLPYASQVVTISPTDANEDENFTINVSFDSRTPEQIELFFDSVTSGSFTTSESVIGTTSGTTAVITEERSDSLLVSVPDGLFEVGETVTSQTSGASFTVTDINSIWNTL